MNHRKHPLARLCLAGSLIPAVTMAQNNAEGKDEKPDNIENVYVEGRAGQDSGRTEFSGLYSTDSMSTATGLGLSPQDTPQSVSVVSRQRIEDQQLDSVVDIVNNTLGLYAQPADNDRYSISARGLSVDTILYDGVPTNYDTRFNYGDNVINSVIYDRVEIVRGATGLMTGSGNPSAAINLVRKMPTRNFHGSASLTAGSWNLMGGSVDLSGPLTDGGAIRGRIVAAHRDQESFQDRYRQVKDTLYGVVQADLTERTTFTVGADYQKTEPEGTMSGGLPIFYSDGTRTDYPQSASTAPSWASAETESLNAFARVEHYFNDQWKIRASYTYGDNDLHYDVLWATGFPDPETNTGMFPGSLTLIDGKRQQSTLDIRLSGEYQLFGREHELAVGWTDRKKDFENPYYGIPYVEAMQLELGNFLAEDWSFSRPEWPDNRLYGQNGVTNESAGFIVTRWSLAEPLTLILGTRVSDWDTDQNSFGTLTDQQVSGEMSNYGGLVWDITGHIAAYTGYAEIFSPQNNFGEDGTYLDPVTGKSVEAGFKGRFMDGRLNASISVFEIRQDNQAEPIPGAEPLPGGITVYRGVDGSKNRGFEAQLTGQLAEGWQVSVGYTDFSAKDPDGEPINTSSPREQFKLFTRYQLPGNWNKLSIGGGVNWQSRSYREVTNPVQGLVEVEQEAYALVNLMAGYAFTEDLQLTVNLNNTLDEQYYAQIGQFTQYQYGAPRNLEATLRYQF